MSTAWPIESYALETGLETTWVSVNPVAEGLRDQLARAAVRHPQDWFILAADAQEALFWEQLPPRVAALAACSQACAGWAVFGNASLAAVEGLHVIVPSQPLADWSRPTLCPQPWMPLDTSLADALRTAVASLPSERARAAVSAGIRLLHDDLDGAHQLAQGLEGVGTPRIADAWHAVMHRREGDAGNSQYWWRRVGPHPAGEVLCQWVSAATDAPWTAWRSRLIRQGAWNPAAHVELCDEVDGWTETAALERLQVIEALALLKLSCDWR